MERLEKYCQHISFNRDYFCIVKGLVSRSNNYLLSLPSSVCSRLAVGTKCYNLCLGEINWKSCFYRLRSDVGRKTKYFSMDFL